ncbi:hypothetical protein L218DRAFT_995978 [Marasmius fiardii PR-910]|nr:hypothetical protein L218DRAFT_995978 [Marasmius fiardii PR-910]
MSARTKFDIDVENILKKAENSIKGILNGLYPCDSWMMRALVECLPNTDDFEIAISETLTEILSLGITKEGPIVMVLDEANAACYQLDRSFRDADGNFYPALKAILDLWTHYLKHPDFFFVIAGTEIPREYSPGSQWSDWVWCSDTGAFDDEETQRSPLRHAVNGWWRGYGSGLEEGGSFAILLHRATASFLAVLLDRQFSLLHVYLQLYILALTEGYQPKDINDEDFEPLPEFFRDLPLAAIDFEVLETDRRLAACIHETLILFLLQYPERIYYSAKDVALVTNTFGRFIDAECQCTAVYEPFIVTAAAVWFTDENHSFFDYSYFAQKVLEPGISSRHALGFAAVCLAVMFDCEGGRALREVFDVPKYLTGWKEFGGFFWSRSVQNTLAWMKSRSTPFCIHDSGDGTPVLIFIVKISNGKRFWSFVRVLTPAPSSEQLHEKIEECIRSCHPYTIFGDTPSAEITKVLRVLPNLSPQVGKSGVMRVVLSFTHDLRKFNLDLNSLDPDDISAVATINSKSIALTTKAYAHRNPREFIHESRTERVMKSIVNAIALNVVAKDSPPGPPERERI